MFVASDFDIKNIFPILKFMVDQQIVGLGSVPSIYICSRQYIAGGIDALFFGHFWTSLLVRHKGVAPPRVTGLV